MFLSRKSLRFKIGLIALLVGTCLVLLPFIGYIQGMYGQYRLEQQWNEAVQSEQSGSKRPVFVPSRGFPPTKLMIPKIGLSTQVVEGTAPSALRQGPGHIPSSAWPGAEGNCCIAGHRNIYGQWFRRLDEISTGDKIILRTPRLEYEYMVLDRFDVLPTETSVLRSTSTPTLTLITCTPVIRPTLRLVVVAELFAQREFKH